MTRDCVRHPTSADADWPRIAEQQTSRRAARFQAAFDRGDLVGARSAAAELGRLNLADSGERRMVLMAAARDAAYERAEADDGIGDELDEAVDGAAKRRGE